MPLKKSKQINFRVTPKTAKKIELQAKSNGKKLQEFLEEAVNFRCAIPEGFWGEVEKIAESFQLPAATVVAHLVIKQTAFDYAWLEVFGEPPPGASREFRFDKDGLITGDELADQLVEEYTEILKKAKEKVTKVTELYESGKSIPKTMDYLLSPIELHSCMRRV